MSIEKYFANAGRSLFLLGALTLSSCSDSGSRKYYADLDNDGNKDTVELTWTRMNPGSRIRHPFGFLGTTSTLGGINYEEKYWTYSNSVKINFGSVLVAEHNNLPNDEIFNVYFLDYNKDGFIDVKLGKYPIGNGILLINDGKRGFELETVVDGELMLRKGTAPTK